MNYSRLMQSKIILIAAGLLLVCVAISYFFVSQNKTVETPQETEELTIKEYTDAKRVYIKDYQNINDPDVQALQKEVEYRLYERASDNENNLNLYTGILKEGTLTRNTSRGVTKISFLVDVIPINVTYMVHVTKYQQNVRVIVGCAPEEQQQPQSTDCEDPEYI